jgi:ectoine hydroxylase-related dioxygenase (phytanoyl-CoA dioxygenase family)
VRVGTQAFIEQLRIDGYVVLPDLVGPSELDRIKRQLAPHLASAPFGRNDFEGLRSQRLYALLAKAPAVVDLVIHPEVLAVLDELLEPSYLLSANIAINVHPGETAQMLHADDGFCALPRPRRALGVSAIWAIDDFTDTNGATEILPGSHLFGDEVVAPDDARIRTIEMSAGSVVVFCGTTLHRGGANCSNDTRLGITPQYCEGWIRQIENMALAIPPRIASSLPSRAQDLLYGIYPPFIGYVDGRDPRRRIDVSSGSEGSQRRGRR